ncbi:MAG: alpha/beta fold hydrolase [Acidimicrobiales bacterium]
MPGITNRNRPSRLRAIWLALVVVAAACTSDVESSSTEDPASTAVTEAADTVGSTSAAGTTADEEATDPLAGESVAFESCVDDVPLSCGVVAVPVDYDDASAGTIDIAVAVHRATSPEDRIGYLFINPGGPGGSGVEYAYAAALGAGAAFTEAVLQRFDIVGFDPRGVAQSEPFFECGAVGEQVGLLIQIDGAVDTEKEVALGEQAVALCVESMGPAAALLGSEAVARDMDEIRKALGADQISYFGASYGSTLGTWYATLFPDRVRAMVVDGADNPVDDLSDGAARIENSIEEGRQFEALLNEALLACDFPECPIFNDGDPIGYYRDRVDELDLVNEAFAGDKTAGALAVITPLYDEATWPELWNGLAALEQGDAQPLIDLAAFQLGESGGGANFTGHVNCLDQWSLQPDFDRTTQLEDVTAAEAATASELPLLSELGLLTAPDPCPFYDTIVARPLGQPLDGGDVPIVVIGNPSDPATPFTESVELVDATLSNGFLVEADHPAHVVYPSNDCVNDLVDGVFIDLLLPEHRRTVCPAAPADG